MSNQYFEYKLQILEHHLDSFGHVNNAEYFKLYEQARWDFITKNGYGLETVKKLKKGPVILEVTCKYRKELVNREWIKIVSHTDEIRGKIMRIRQQMLKEDGAVASEAVFVIGFMDLELRKLISPTSEWLKAIGAE